MSHDCTVCFSLIALSGKRALHAGGNLGEPPKPPLLKITPLLRALTCEPAAALIAVPLCASMVSLTVRLEPEALAITRIWLATDFEGGRHIARVNKIDAQ